MPDGYALNPNTGVLHRYPAFEGCNLDDALILRRSATDAPLRADPKYKRDCKRCMGPH